jgi:hypothetical protein
MKIVRFLLIGIKLFLIAIASVLIGIQVVVNFFYNLLEYAIDWLYYKAKKDE